MPPNSPTTPTASPIKKLLAAAVSGTKDDLVKTWLSKLLRDGQDAAGDLLLPTKAAQAAQAAK